MNNKTSKNNLFNRVDNILHSAHKKIVSTVNLNIITAYWFIGREIILELQDGDKRAGYGKKIIEELAQQLNEKYKKGYSVRNLHYFRKFYSLFSDRISILHPLGAELSNEVQISSNTANNNALQIVNPLGAELENIKQNSFSPQLTWSHYRALLKVKDDKVRQFYEEEAIACGWDKRALERQIHTAYYQRMVKSKNPQKMINSARKDVVKRSENIDFLKNPYVLEFLNLPEDAKLKESELESTIITHIQSFLLELGKGFSFVARQKKMIYEDNSFYIDLVFYNSILKCHLLIDLKIGKLSHRDVGQMDSYVRMFDDLFIASDDKPTIGLILCNENNSTVAKYSVLNDTKQLFASKYMLYMPTEEELRIEIDKEIKLIKEHTDIGDE